MFKYQWLQYSQYMYASMLLQIVGGGANISTTTRSNLSSTTANTTSGLHQIRFHQFSTLKPNFTVIKPVSIKQTNLIRSTTGSSRNNNATIINSTTTASTKSSSTKFPQKSAYPVCRYLTTKINTTTTPWYFKLKNYRLSTFSSDDRLSHTWVCDGSVVSKYCLLVRNCVALVHAQDSSQPEKPVLVIDEQGCSVNRELLKTPAYSWTPNVQIAGQITRADLTLRCEISLFEKVELGDSCRPPVCRASSTSILNGQST